MIREYQSTLSILHRLLDAVWVAGSLWGLALLYEVEWRPLYDAAVALGAGTFYLFGSFNGLYRSWRSVPLYREYLCVASCWIGTVMALMLLAFAFKVSAVYSRRAVLTWMVAAPLVLCVWRTLVRTALREMRKRGANTRTVAVAGAGRLGQSLARGLLGHAHWGLRLAGFYDDEKPAGSRPLEDASLTVKGDLDDLVRKARRGEVDRVYLALPTRAEKRIREVLADLGDTTASVYLVPDLFTFELSRAPWVELHGVPMVSVFDTPFDGVGGVLKRLEDIVLAGIFLAAAAVPILLVAAAVKWTSPGPVLFRQRRYGLDGREFEIWKFRTMTVCEDGDRIPQAVPCDPRVTRLGAFLRRTSLDELPQFVNVLQGRMSLVGPRPHAVAHNEEYRKVIRGYMMRHKVKPGITGLAQVNGWRGETDTLEKMEKRVEHDLEYIRNWSLFLDLKIIALTVLRGAWRHNAY